MIDTTFHFCKRILIVLSNWLGISYEAINVWIFVIIWPIFTLVLMAVVIAQRIQIRRLREQ